MNVQKQPEESTSEKKKFMGLNLAFSASFVVHIVLFCLLGGAIVQYGKLETSTFDSLPLDISDQVNPAPPEVEENENPVPEDSTLVTPDQISGGAVSTDAMSPDVIVADTQQVNPMMFSSNAPTISLGSGTGSGQGAGTGTGTSSGAGKGTGAPRMSGLFGTKEASAEGLTGYMYDLKQSVDRKPLETNAADVLKNMVDRWDEKTLSKFYKSPEPLTSFQWFIPVMGADGAPKAFNVEKDVKPSNWLIFYQGKVTSSVTGTFRFVGIGDDVLLVRFNRKFIFDGGWFSQFAKEMNNEKGENNGPYTGNSDMFQRVGSWFNVKAGETYPMDVMIGEIPGQAFSIFLMIQEKGKTYEKRPDGKGVLLPVFQTAPIDVPAFEHGRNGPLIAPQPFNFTTGTPAAAAAPATP